MNQIATSSTSSFLSAMNADVNVGMNEVVSVFVSKYEDGLFEKKEQLSKQIKVVKSQLAKLTERVLNSVNKDQYVTVISLLGLKTKVVDVSIVWDETNYSHKEKNSVYVSVGLFEDDGDYSKFNKTFVTSISREDVKENKELSENLSSLSGELIEIVSLIKSVSRKERQIRGKISEMKLEQSGFSELMSNTEMLKLISID